MDLKVSRKETRMQPDGPVEVLVSDIFDIYPLYSPTDPNLLMDAQFLDDPRTELLDRAMFATVKQRGANPLEPGDGVEWAEAVIGERTVPVIMQQIQQEISEEGPGVQVVYDTQTAGNGKKYFRFSVKLTNAT